MTNLQKEKRYIAVGIYKNGSYDCSNGGLSSKYNNCYVEVEGGYLKESELNKDQIVVLAEGAFGSVIAKPIVATKPNSTGYMMGGCYIASSDSRFSEAVEKLLGHSFYGAIPLHDRTETWEQCDLLSR